MVITRWIVDFLRSVGPNNAPATFDHGTNSDCSCEVIAALKMLCFVQCPTFSHKLCIQMK